jgi:hypothetical protein
MTICLVHERTIYVSTWNEHCAPFSLEGCASNGVYNLNVLPMPGVDNVTGGPSQSWSCRLSETIYDRSDRNSCSCHLSPGEGNLGMMRSFINAREGIAQPPVGIVVAGPDAM